MSLLLLGLLMLPLILFLDLFHLAFPIAFFLLVNFPLHFLFLLHDFLPLIVVISCLLVVDEEGGIDVEQLFSCSQGRFVLVFLLLLFLSFLFLFFLPEDL